MREPFVAGQFYPAKKELLLRVIRDAFLHPLGPKKDLRKDDVPGSIIGAIAPHMGYMYSAPILASVYYELAAQRVPEAVVILGTNHYAPEVGAAVSTDNWRTPLGVLKVSDKLMERLTEGLGLVTDEKPHLYEHSIEVQLPFIQYAYGNPEILPIGLGRMEVKDIRKLAMDLARVLEEEDAIVIASSDFTHFESKEEVKRRDNLAIERILRLDFKGFYEVLEKERASLCGANPIGTLLLLAEMLKAKPDLLRYSLSSEVIGDDSNIVGLAGLVFRRQR